MTDENKTFTKPFNIESKDVPKPFVLKSPDGNFKFYIDKKGYRWGDNLENTSERVVLAYGKLDANDDINGKKKSVTLPSALTKDQLSKFLIQ